MQSHRLAAFFGAVALVGGLAGIGSATNEPRQTKGDIWQDEPTESRQTWWRRDLTDETVNKIMEGLRKRDPAKAKELEKLKSKFKARRHIKESAGRPWQRHPTAWRIGANNR